MVNNFFNNKATGLLDLSIWTGDTAGSCYG